MRCLHLSLTNLRTYRRLEVDLPAGVSLYWGNNAQGKTNLLEALYMLATTKSFRTKNEWELIAWTAAPDQRFARISADLMRQQSTIRLDITLAEAPSGPAHEVDQPSELGRLDRRPIQKRVRINSQPRRAVDALGQFNVVLFAPEDVELVTGPPAQRRRYLDITLCQVDPHYLRVLSHYNRVLAQRNALLRQLRDRRLPQDQLQYWTDQLIELGSAVMLARLQAISTLNGFLAEIHPRLVDEQARLHIAYRSSVALGEMTSSDATPASQETLQRSIQDQFAAQLTGLRDREQRQAITLAGPHRDDLALTTGEIDVQQYGSRGQQRTAVLAIKLAEIEFMRQRTGERPVLLLDDVLSELDPRRRRLLQEVIAADYQVLVTATEREPFSAEFLRAATVFEVVSGDLHPSTT